MSARKLKVAIVGAGATGLAAAWDLSAAGHEVTIYESEARVGGLAGGFKDEGWDWWLEKFYHHWFQTDHDILNLAEELGVREQITFPRPKTSFWIDGKIYRSEISPSALFLPLPPLAKLRFGLAGAFVKLMPDWRGFERVTADDWFMTFMGEAAYDKFFRPLLIGKFGEEYDKVNMAWMWARIKTRTLRLGIFQGGFQAFLDLFGEKLAARGVTICLNQRVERIAVRKPDMTPYITVDGEELPFDRVLSTTSPGLMMRLTPDLRDTNYGDMAFELRSIGAICVVFALKQQLLTDGTYWLNLPASDPDRFKSRFPFLALVEHTNWMDRAHYGGDHLIYCGDYLPPSHAIFKMSDDKLAEFYLKSLPTFNPDFNPDWVRKFWVFRAPYAQPIPYRMHSERIPATQTPLPGIFWASMSQVYPYDRGTNYAVRLGRAVAAQMMR